MSTFNILYIVHHIISDALIFRTLPFQQILFNVLVKKTKQKQPKQKQTKNVKNRTKKTPTNTKTQATSVLLALTSHSGFSELEFCYKN